MKKNKFDASLTEQLLPAAQDLEAPQPAAVAGESKLENHLEESQPAVKTESDEEKANQAHLQAINQFLDEQPKPEANAHRRKEQELEFYEQREKIMAANDFTKNYPPLAKLNHSLPVTTIKRFSNEAVMIGGGVTGSALIDWAIRLQSDPAFVTCLALFCYGSLAPYAVKSARSTELKLFGTKRKFDELLAEKQLMTAKTSHALNYAPAVFLEHACNAGFLGMSLVASTMITNPAQYETGMTYLLIGAGIQMLGSIAKMGTDLRFAQELAGHPFNRKEVTFSDAVINSIWVGGLSLISGSISLAFGDGPGSLSHDIGLGLVITGMLVGGGLGLRARGSDHVVYALDKVLGLNIGDKYLESKLLGFRDSRTDVVDFLNWGAVTFAFSGIANAVHKRNEIGFLSAATIASMGVILLKLLSHSYSRTLLQRVWALMSCDATLAESQRQEFLATQKAVVSVAESKGKPNCYHQAKDKVGQALDSAYMFFTKMPDVSAVCHGNKKAVLHVNISTHAPATLQKR